LQTTAPPIVGGFLLPMQPEKEITGITLRLGMTWISSEDIEAFTRDELGIIVAVDYSQVANCWEIHSPYSNPHTTANTVKYGLSWEDVDRSDNLTPKSMTGLDLLEKALNLQIPQIRVRTEAGSRIDPGLTANALHKQELLHQAFNAWVKRSEIRSRRFTLNYNRLFCSDPLPEYDGRDLTFREMSAEWRSRIQSRRYQLDGIKRGLSDRNLGSYWEMGLGKMPELIAIAMERIHRGLSAKAILCVKKNTLEQFQRTIAQMYPSAKTLAATTKELGKDRQGWIRQAGGDWDLLLITHEHFTSIPLSPKSMRSLLEVQLRPVAEELDRLNPRRATVQQGRISKTLLAMESRLQKQLSELPISQEGLFFEDLGCDLLLADEAHLFKRRSLSTKLTGIAGLPSKSASARGDDFESKVRWMQRQYGAGCLVKASGTPINNTIAECFTELWDLHPERMAELGLNTFDACVAQFCQVNHAIEIKPTGELGPSTRLDRFINLPELKRLLFAVADVRTAEEVGLKVPKAKIVKVVAPMTPAQRKFQDSIVDRANLIRAGQPLLLPTSSKGLVVSKPDNYLWLSTHARQAALDYRLIDPSTEDHPKTKVNQLVHRVYKLWKRTRKKTSWSCEKATQLIICDLGTPSSASYNLYEYIRSELICLGMPPRQICFSHEWMGDRRELLVDRLNSGEVAVVIASSEQWGLGTNAQERAIAAHLLTPTWRPDQYQQCIARVARYGNRNSRVLICLYMTAGVAGNFGFDSFMFQRCQSKATMSYSLLSPDMETRSYSEEQESAAFRFAELKACASGDERLIALVQAQSDLESKRSLLRSLEAGVERIRAGGSVHRKGLPFYRLQSDRIEQEIIELEELAIQAEVDMTKAKKAKGVHIEGIGTVKDLISGLLTMRDVEGLAIGSVREIPLVASKVDGKIDLWLQSWRPYPIRFVQDARLLEGRIAESLEALTYALDEIARRAEERRQAGLECERTILEMEAELPRQVEERDAVAREVEVLSKKIQGMEAEFGVPLNS
jgi:hypothetical protein